MWLSTLNVIRTFTDDDFLAIEGAKHILKMVLRTVEWFLENKADKIQIPYVEQNQKNKLRQLAQQNNRAFKKILLG